MKKVVLSAAGVQSYKPRLFDSASAYALLDKIQTKYHFKSAPTFEQLSQNQLGPFNFIYGTFPIGDRTVVIEQFVVTYIGVTTTSVGASTKTDTDDVDRFLSEVETIARECAVDTTKINPDYHQSTLEVVFDKAISGHFDQLGRVIERLTGMVRGYGFDWCPEFELSGFSLQVDSTGGKLPYIQPFTIER